MSQNSAADNPLVCAHHFSPRDALISAVSGGIAGISIDFALFPVDSIKTRLQLKASSKKVDYTKEAQQVSKYKGFLSAMLAAFPCAAVFWCTYEYSKFTLWKNMGDRVNVSVQHIIAATLAEVTQALVRNPFEVVKQNLQLGHYSGMVECAADIVKHKGIGGLYQGYLSLILREIPFSSIQFPFYEVLKMSQIKLVAYRTQKSESTVELPAIANALNGGMAGSFAGFIVTPFDVLKTKLMTHSVKQETPSTFKVFREVLHEDGIRGLYRGAGMRMIYLGVGGSAFFGIYEKVKSTLLGSIEGKE
ncbi:hypothetical protein FGO68_gene1189 [Halteria grandinella]|uniref:Mitochondrial carrier protein n=1 Tax=Halteria grandinella TaxID=5974 RepID=A0A8J8P486_HALGN|nr:hypothetical protein FGO68_gene1189 [Halteria grandinella]